MSRYRAFTPLLRRRRQVGGYIPAVLGLFNEPNVVTPSWLDTSGIVGNRMYFDSTGTLTWAPNNMLLNSATLATQTVTVTVGATNILSFYGTGSITLSGAATGTLTGTGVSDRVSLVITPSTTSLVLTVSGSVTQAQLERVTYQTSPRAYIPTTSAAVYLLRYDYDPATLQPRGLLIEESRQNSCLNSQTVGGTGWTSSISGVAASPTVSTNYALAPDGTQTASRIQFSLNNGTTTSDYVWTSQAIAMTAARGSYFVKTNDNSTKTIYVRGASPASLVVTGSWTRIEFNAGGTGAVGTFGIGLRGGQVPVNSDSVDLLVWGAQLENNATFATSYIPTVAASVTRAADVVALSGSALTVAGAATGSVIVQTTLWRNATAAIDLMSSATTRRLLYSDSSNTALSSTDGTTKLDATIGGAGTFTDGVVRSAVAWGANGRSLVANGGTVASDAVVMGTGATATLGGYGSTTTFNGWVASVAFYSQRIPNDTLKAKSVLGASF